MRNFVLALLSMICAGCSAGNRAQIDASVFERTDLIYGSELGSWPMNNDRYDGYPILRRPNLVRRAGITVVKWAVWNVFDGMEPPPGQTSPPMTRAQFDAVVDGIRDRFGALVMIKLQPSESDPPGLFCPDRWSEDRLADFNRLVVAQAGARVQLYELTNEMELDCGFGEDAGVRLARHWIAQAPMLKKHARSLGFEIYLGGPGLQSIDGTMSAPGTRSAVDFLRTVHDAYEDPSSPVYHDPDVVPSFFSFHGYADDCVDVETNGPNTTELDCVRYYGLYVDEVRLAIDRIWGPQLGPRIKIAQTEWNFGQEKSYDRSPTAVWNARAPAFYGAMLQMFRQHGVWMANQFAIGSNDGPMDMIGIDGGTRPYYDAFVAAQAR